MTPPLPSCRHGADRRLLDREEEAIAEAVIAPAIALLLAIVVIDRLARQQHDASTTVTKLRAGSRLRCSPGAP